jgi:hypothetical protein
LASIVDALLSGTTTGTMLEVGAQLVLTSRGSRRPGAFSTWRFSIHPRRAIASA